MGLKGKEKPKQLLAPATADVGAGEMTAELPTWLLAGLRRAVGVCRSTWTYLGLGELVWGEAAVTRLGRGHGAPGRWQEGVGVRCDERFKHRRPSAQPGEMWLVEDPLRAISIQWPKIVLATVLFQLVSDTKSVVGIFCVFLSWFCSLRSSTSLQMLQT